MNTAFNKAIAAVLVPLAVFLLAKVGFQADDSIVAALTTIVTAAAVYLVPNKQPAA